MIGNHQEHPELSKTERKRLCRILDCQKLSPEVRAHAVKNERLPLRTVVQLLFFEQESGSRAAPQPQELVSRRKQTPFTEHDISKLKLDLSSLERVKGTRKTTIPETSLKRSDKKLQLVEPERNLERGGTITVTEGVESEKGQFDFPKKKVIQRTSKLEHKGRDR